LYNEHMLGHVCLVVTLDPPAKDLPVLIRHE
jgi:hypothetical protein